MVTHRPVGTVRTDTNWDVHNFDQIDYLLVRSRWKNSVRNCETDVNSTIDSDHYLMWMIIKITF